MGKLGAGGLLVGGIFLVLVGALIQSAIFEWLIDVIGTVLVVAGIVLAVVGIVRMVTGGRR